MTLQVLFVVLSTGFSLLLFGQGGGQGRDSLPAQKAQRLLFSLDQKTSKSIKRLEKANGKYLSKLLKQEKKLQKKLWKKDSLLAKELFSGVEEKYNAFSKAPENMNKYSAHYSGHLDSLTTGLNFLKGEGKLPIPSQKLNGSLSRFKDLQSRLDGADQLKKFVAQRRKLLKEKLGSVGMLRELKGYQKQAYYYSAQVKEYKALFEEPSKWEEKLVSLALNSSQFKEFFRNNSMLGTLFALPGGNAGSTSSNSLQGLQTRASVQGAIQARFGSGPNVTQALQQNMQQAQGELSKLKDKVASFGSGSYGSGDDVDLPEGYKPNTQKTKTFLNRLEYGANIQSRGTTMFLPVTTDLGLSLGYKLSDKSSIGIGAAYTLGWGSSWNNIRVRSEGMGIRSYLDWKLKGSLFVSGGYELNYRLMLSERISLSSLPGGDFSNWQKSGLVGLAKKYKVSKKLKGDIKLMWDFLSYQQVPRTQAIVFRVGWSLK